MEMTTRSSTRVKAAKWPRGVKGFRGSGVKGAGIFDFGFWIWPLPTCPRPSWLPAPRMGGCPLTRGDFDWAESERCKGEKVRRWAEDFGFWMLDVGFMGEVERSFLQRSRRRKWCEGEKVGKWEGGDFKFLIFDV